MRLINTREEAGNFQNSLVTLFSCFSQPVKHVAKYSGGTKSCDTYFIPNLGLWMMPCQLSNRYWNAFGVADGADLSSRISVEMNHPYEGSPGGIAGRFVKDGPRMVLAHTGALRGIKGIGRAFINRHIEKMHDIGIGKPVLFSCHLDEGEKALDQIAQYASSAQSIREEFSAARKAAK